jgi:hypothetical protein
MEEPIKQCYEMNGNKSDIGVKSWAVELKEELQNIGLALVWRK